MMVSMSSTICTRGAMAIITLSKMSRRRIVEIRPCVALHLNLYSTVLYILYIDGLEAGPPLGLPEDVPLVSSSASAKRACRLSMGADTLSVISNFAYRCKETADSTPQIMHDSCKMFSVCVEATVPAKKKAIFRTFCDGTSPFFRIKLESHNNCLGVSPASLHSL
jgi:hypothetical protein